MRTHPEGLTRTEAGWSWDLTNYELMRVAFDHAASLEFVSQSAYAMEIRIEGDFQVALQSGSQVFASTSDRHGAYVTLLSALHQAGGRLDIADTGELQIVIGKVLQITVPSPEAFETWTLADLNGIDGIKMVAGVGKQLHIWGLDRE